MVTITSHPNTTTKLHVFLSERASRSIWIWKMGTKQ